MRFALAYRDSLGGGRPDAKREHRRNQEEVLEQVFNVMSVRTFLGENAVT